MRIARIAAVAGVVGLAGCSVGTAPGAGAVSGNYKLQTNYQDAYRYATVQAERCLVGQGCYRVVGELDDNARTGLVRVVAPFFDGEMARVEIGTIDAHSSNVYIGMWGKSIWNTDALRAMREAVVYGVPSCVAYMPAIRRRPRKSLAPAQPLGSVAAGALDDLERGGGLGHQFTGAVADLSFAEGDRRAAAQAARFDDQVAAPRGHEAGVHVDGGHADFGVSPRMAAPRVKSSTLISVPPWMSPRLLTRSARAGSRVRAVPLPECSGTTPSNCMKGMVRPKKSVCGVDMMGSCCVTDLW